MYRKPFKGEGRHGQNLHISFDLLQNTTSGRVVFWIADPDPSRDVEIHRVCLVKNTVPRPTLAGWLAGWLLAGWLACSGCGWLAGCLAGWLAGWLVELLVSIRF